MTLEAVARAMDKGGAPLGDLVGWELADANTPVATLREKWANEGLPENLLPETPTPAKALKVAAQRVNTRLGDGYRVEVITEGDEPALSIQRRRVSKDNDGARVDWHQTACAILRGPTLYTPPPSGNEERTIQADLAKEYSEFLATHTTDDVRRCFVRTVQSWQAFSVFRGVYWIQPYHAADVRKLQRVVEGIGESVFKLIPVTASPEGQSTLQVAAQASLEQDLADLLAEMGRFVDKPPKSAETLEARLRTFEDLRAKADLYRTVLGAKVGEIEQHLDSMAKLASKMITTL